MSTQPSGRGIQPLRSDAPAHRDQPEAEEEPADAPQVVADEVQSCAVAARVADASRSRATSSAVPRNAALTRIATALTRPKAAEPGRERVDGAEQPKEPQRGERLGQHDEQLQRDADPREGLLVDQVARVAAASPATKSWAG